MTPKCTHHWDEGRKDLLHAQSVLGKRVRTSGVLQSQWFVLHAGVWPMQIKMSCVFWLLQMPLTYQCSGHLFGTEISSTTDSAPGDSLAVLIRSGSTDTLERLKDFLCYGPYPALAEQGSLAAVSSASLTVRMQVGKDKHSPHVLCLALGWCGTPMSWLLHAFIIGKTHTWIQFCSSEGPGRERPGHCGVDVKAIKHDFQLPVV